MKALTLTSSLATLLSLSAFGQSDSSIQSSISAKEKEILRLKKEITSLKTQLKPVSVSGTGTYRVKTGDTVNSIAREHHLTPSKLIALNNLSDPSKISIDQMLHITSKGPQKAPAKPTSKTPLQKGSDYTVQKGDTFYSIARKHQMTVTQLRALNPEIKTHLITLGSTLKVIGTPLKAETKPKVVVTQKAPKTSAPVSTNKPKKSAAPKPPVKVAKAPPVVEKTVATPPAPEIPKKEIASAAADPTPPKTEEPVVAGDSTPKKPTSIASIILTDETTFEAFAQKHGVSTKDLNTLNGWSLPQATVLARGSEIYVPK